MASLSVVIPTYNKLEEVMLCLSTTQACADQTVLTQWLIQDDCSPALYLPKLIPPCSALTARNEHNLGFPGNCNAGALRAQGDILLFLNQDTYAIEQDGFGLPYSLGWNKALIDAFDNPEVGIVGAKLLTPDGRVQSVGGEFDAYGQPFHRCLGYVDHRYEDCNTPREVSWVTGGALAIRRELFAQVGGFDTDYVRGYFEDVDLCMRVKALGYKVWFEPRCGLVHVVGTSGAGTHFMHNAQLFKSRWVDTGKVKPDTYAVKCNWWRKEG